MNCLKIIGKSFIDFFRDGGIVLAGSLSYFTMMALVPFCLFLITLFGFILGQYHQFYDFFSSRLSSFFPAITSGITGELSKLVRFKGIGAFSILLYGFLSLQVFASIEHALQVIFKVEQKRHVLWSVVISFVMVTFIIIMLTISFAATSLIPLLKTLRHLFPELRIGMITGFLIQYVVPFFMVLFTVTVMYIFFPRTKVKLPHALTGAFFTAALLEIAKHLFTWYVGTVVKFGTIYGPLSAFVIFLLWMFYSSCIFLVGAELVHNLSAVRKRK
ncbi:MAG: YihY/virulence factor BrkB family protein [Nitrospirota bacterium]